MPDDNDTPVYAVLGATGGIGSALCRKLARGGAHLALGARSDDDLNDLAGELDDASAHPLDATDYDAVEAFIEDARAEHDRLDGVTNCVGSIMLNPAHLTSVEEFEKTLDLNLRSAFYTVKAAVQPMMKSGGGAIALSAAAVAQTGVPNHGAIASAKGGVISLTRSAAATYAKNDVRVNAVAPGLVQTPLTERVTQNDASREQSEEMHALDRLGEPDDVASALRWLLDPTSDWVTGQVVGIDGGLTLKSR
jgi:NAD(P)-dependent dehydrogenase (short-subunit alcohol dehydrogenase family)